MKLDQYEAYICILLPSIPPKTRQELVRRLIRGFSDVAETVGIPRYSRLESTSVTFFCSRCTANAGDARVHCATSRMFKGKSLCLQFTGQDGNQSRI